MGLDRHIPGLGRLGRLLRPGGPAHRGRERLRARVPGSSSALTPTGTSTTRRSASTPTLSSSRTTSSTASESTPKPTDDPTPGRRPGGREDPRQPDRRLQLRPVPPGPGRAARAPQDHTDGHTEALSGLRRRQGPRQRRVGPPTESGCRGTGGRCGSRRRSRCRRGRGSREPTVPRPGSTGTWRDPAGPL